VFVRHALPGEHVTARLTQAREADRFWRADAVQVLRPSPDRVEPPCPVARPGLCGGCDWQHASLPAQRQLKATVVREQFTRLAGAGDLPVVAGLVVEQVSGSDDGLGWRTRVRFAIDEQGRAGLRAHRSHDVVPVQECPIAAPEVNATGVGRAHWPGATSVEVSATPGDAAAGDTGGGRPAQQLVVVEGPRPPRSALPEAPAAAIAHRTPEGLEQVRGRTWIEERVLLAGTPDPEERRFRVTGGGFWQVHPGAARTLLDAVLAAAAPRPGERALDLYCGAGLFTAGLARRVGSGGQVTGVEGDARAAADARRNLHDLPWVRLVHAPVDGDLARLCAPDGASPQVVVLDPPRTGAGRQVVAAVTALRPRVVVYVACDPAALARDVATAGELGYQLTGLRAFDLFPMTHHVECVATLTPA
jgi:tRNA/tmRNA/rRNA uracil-C5-methylase (TrmA/RlmC/RlmD family)